MCGINLGAAREKVRTAHALASLPRISAAMERGELSYAKVRAGTRRAGWRCHSWQLVAASRRCLRERHHHHTQDRGDALGRGAYGLRARDGRVAEPNAPCAEVGERFRGNAIRPSDPVTSPYQNFIPSDAFNVRGTPVIFPIELYVTGSLLGTPFCPQFRL